MLLLPVVRFAPAPNPNAMLRSPVLLAKHPTPTAVFNLPVVLPFSRKTRSRIVVTGRVALKRNSTSSGVFEPGCVRNERLATTDCVAGSGCILKERSKALSTYSNLLLCC